MTWEMNGEADGGGGLLVLGKVLVVALNGVTCHSYSLLQAIKYSKVILT